LYAFCHSRNRARGSPISVIGVVRGSLGKPLFKTFSEERKARPGGLKCGDILRDLLLLSSCFDNWGNRGVGRRPSFDHDEPHRVGRSLKELLPLVLRKIGRRVHGDREIVLATWPEIVGAQFAPMARAVSFEEGVLTVTVSNASLYSLLAHRDRKRLLQALRDKLPNVEIKHINVRIGS
jgi:hypothetical protein